MRPPRRRMTTRALIVLTALFALDLAAIARLIRAEAQQAWALENRDLINLFAIVLLLATIAIVFRSIYLYVPPPMDEALMALLILLILVALLIPAMRASRSRASRPAGPGGAGRPDSRVGGPAALAPRRQPSTIIHT